MLVDVGHMLGQSEVIVRVTLVPDEPEEVKTGEEGGRQLDVGLGGLLDVVATESRIGSCQDRHTSIEGCHDASLGKNFIIILKRYVSLVKVVNHYIPSPN